PATGQEQRRRHARQGWSQPCRCRSGQTCRGVAAARTVSRESPPFRARRMSNLDNAASGQDRAGLQLPVGGSADRVDGSVEDRQALVQLRVADGQRRQQLDYLATRARGLRQQAGFEGGGGHLASQIAVGERQAPGHAPAADQDRKVRYRIGGRGDGRHDPLALGERAALQAVIAPVGAQRGGAGHQRGVDATERAVVLAWRPDVQVESDQRERERQPVPADGLRQANDVRGDPRGLEAEERACPAAAHLDIVDDEQDAVLSAQFRQATQPLRARDVDPALALYGLDDRRGRGVQAAALVLEQALEPLEVRYLAVWIHGFTERNRGRMT